MVGRKSPEWLAKNLGRAQVMCLPSVSEGMSNALLEAMAVGLPVIVTKTGGSDELVDGNGIMVKKRSEIEIYRALKKLYEDKGLRLRMGRRSREIVEKMSWERAAKKFYEEFS